MIIKFPDKVRLPTNDNGIVRLNFSGKAKPGSKPPAWLSTPVNPR